MTTTRWPDRLLFAGLGALVGFAVAWVSLEGRGTAPPAVPAAAGPQAGVPGAPPMGGGAAAMTAGPAVDPAVRQRLQEATVAAQAQPGDYETLVRLGNAAYDAHEFAQAADAYEKALKVKAEDVNVMTDLGTAYRNLGQTDKALEMFRKASARDPKHWQSLYNEVIVLAVDKGDVPAAKKVFDRLKADNPGLPALQGLEQQLSGAAAGK